MTLAVAGIAKWSGTRSGTGPAAGGLLTEADPSLGNDSTVSAKFLAAREALYRGDFPSARQQFTTLAADPATRQPTVNWARYNAGLAALFLGYLTASRKDFAAIRESGP